MKINKITSLVTMIVLCASATAVADTKNKILGGPSVNTPVTQLKSSMQENLSFPRGNDRW